MTRFRLSGRLLDSPARLLLAVEQGACGSVLQMLPNGATVALMLPTDVVGDVAPPAPLLAPPAPEPT